MSGEIVGVDVCIHARTDFAILASEDGDEDSAEWLPLSQVEVDPLKGNAAHVTMPEWLAIKKGFA